MLVALLKRSFRSFAEWNIKCSYFQVNGDFMYISRLPDKICEKS